MTLQGFQVGANLGIFLHQRHEVGNAVGILHEIYRNAVLIGLVGGVIIVQSIVGDVAVVAACNHQGEGGGGVHHVDHLEVDMDVGDLLKLLIEQAHVVGGVHDSCQRWGLGIEHGKGNGLLGERLKYGPVKVLVAGYGTLNDFLFLLRDRGFCRRGFLLLRGGFRSGNSSGSRIGGRGCRTAAGGAFCFASAAGQDGQCQCGCQQKRQQFLFHIVSSFIKWFLQLGTWSGTE